VLAWVGDLKRLEGLEAPLTGRDAELSTIRELSLAATERRVPHMVLNSGPVGRASPGSPQARSENLNFTLSAAEVVAAAAVVAAGLPVGEAVAREITRHDYDVTALVISGSDPELAGVALAALLTAAGYDGAWHGDWIDPRTAMQGRRTTDELASVFYRDQHRHDQELPQEP
jgi:hypothetical protein